MSFHKNDSFYNSNQLIGISIGKSSPTTLHNKLLINFEGTFGELHLAFHHDLRFSDTLEESSQYIWDIPIGIPISRLKALAAKCVKIIKNMGKQEIPYAIEYKGKRKFDKEGIYNSYFDTSEYGVTCSTFILTIFESVGLEIIDWKNWQNRNEDQEWFNNLIRLINIERWKKTVIMSDEHFNNLRSEQNCKKIRPEEIFSIVYCNSYPMKFSCSSSIGSHIRNYVLQII